MKSKVFLPFTEEVAGKHHIETYRGRKNLRLSEPMQKENKCRWRIYIIEQARTSHYLRLDLYIYIIKNFIITYICI